jgi:predicted CXXCH cytochrome family protein
MGLASVGLALMLAPMGASALISGSAHDFSTQGWAGGEICVACHTPHNADTTVPEAPLWNHALTTSVFTVYSSVTGTLDATVGQPDGISKLCLSCHDGSVALDSFGGNTGTIFIGGPANLGTDLTDDHPISFTYDTALATTDGELHDPAVATTVLGGTIDADLLSGGKMQCSSCHDVHNTNVQADPLLVITTASSTLCLTCHDK